MIEKYFQSLELDDFELFTEGSVGNIFNQYNNYKTISNSMQSLSKTELIKRGFVDKDGILSANVLQNLYSENITPLFRKSTTSNETYIALWLSKIIQDAKLLIANGQIKQFTGLSKENLEELVHLSIDESIINHLPNYFAERGIVLIYEKSFPGMKLDGAVLQLSSGHPVIGISFRYPRIDHFWFTLLHELSHVVLHLDTLASPIIDDLETPSEELIERQANLLAKNTFVPRNVWRTCEAKYDSKDEAVINFAKKVKIHPAIVAGLLQHEKNKFDIYGSIVNKINTRKQVFGDE